MSSVARVNTPRIGQAGSRRWCLFRMMVVALSVEFRVKSAESAENVVALIVKQQIATVFQIIPDRGYLHDQDRPVASLKRRFISFLNVVEP